MIRTMPAIPQTLLNRGDPTKPKVNKPETICGQRGAIRRFLARHDGPIVKIAGIQPMGA